MTSNTPPFNRPSFGSPFGNPFGKPFGPEGGAPFSPLDLANLIAWYDPAQGVSTISGDVDQWDDQSVNANHLQQLTTVRRPFYDTGANPFINFDGVDDFLEANNWNGGAISQPITIISVQQETTLLGGTTWPWDSNVTDDIGMLSVAGSGNWQLFAGGGPNLQTPRDTNKNVFVFVVNTAGTSFIYINGGAAKVSGAVGTDPMNGLHMGSRATTGNNSNVNMYDWACYDRLLSNSEINEVANFFAAKDGASWTYI